MFQVSQQQGQLLGLVTLVSAVIVVGEGCDADLADVIKECVQGAGHDVWVAAGAGRVRVVVLHSYAALDEARLIERIGMQSARVVATFSVTQQSCHRQYCIKLAITIIKMSTISGLLLAQKETQVFILLKLSLV